MAQSKLNAKKRVRLGKSGVRKIRKEGNIPAILYGKETEPIPLVINPSELKIALSTDAGRNTLLDIEIESDEDNRTNRLSILREIQVDYISSKPIHLDFQIIDTDKKVAVKIPIKPIGRAQGIKEGGILEEIIREIDVECLPINIPNVIEIDVTELNLGQSIHISDLELPEGATSLIGGEETVLTVLIPKAMSVEEEEVEELEEGEEGEVTEEPKEETAESESSDEEG